MNVELLVHLVSKLEDSRRNTKHASFALDLLKRDYVAEVSLDVRNSSVILSLGDVLRSVLIEAVTGAIEEGKEVRPLSSRHLWGSMASGNFWFPTLYPYLFNFLLPNDLGLGRRYSVVTFSWT